MGKLTLEDLRQLRQSKKQELNRRDTADKNIKVIIGMGTCGIAAGAKETFDAFVSELGDNDLDNVLVTQTGCMGACQTEPTVEVIVPGMPNIIYGKVDKDVAKDIVRKHIMNKKLVNNHIQDQPSIDIIEQ